MSVVIPRGFTKRNFPVRRRRKPVRRKLAARVRKLEVSKERKTLDQTLNTSASGTNPGQIGLTNSVQGVTDETRLGNKITVVGIQFRYLFVDTVSNTCRFMIIHDKQSNGAAYADSDILQDDSAIDNIVSLRNRDNMLRFQVLYDRVHPISLTGMDQAYVSKFIKLNIPIKYDGNAGTIADLASSSLSVFHMCKVSASELTMHVRVFYTDG